MLLLTGDGLSEQRGADVAALAEYAFSLFRTTGLPHVILIELRQALIFVPGLPHAVLLLTHRLRCRRCSHSCSRRWSAGSPPTRRADTRRRGGGGGAGLGWPWALLYTRRCRLLPWLYSTSPTGGVRRATLLRACGCSTDKKRSCFFLKQSRHVISNTHDDHRRVLSYSFSLRAPFLKF